MTTHKFTCDGCGADAGTSAAWRLRHPPLLCLACTRVKNGWNCMKCGSTDPHHPVTCVEEP